MPNYTNAQQSQIETNRVFIEPASHCYTELFEKFVGEDSHLLYALPHVSEPHLDLDRQCGIRRNRN